MWYCGIDVAKRKHAVVVLDEHSKLYKPVFEVENTHAGTEFLLGVQAKDPFEPLAAASGGQKPG